MNSTDGDGHHHSGSSCRPNITRGRLGHAIGLIISLIFLAFWIILILAYLDLLPHPSKPSFILQDATVFAFNVTGNPPSFLTSSFQVTISSRNPNGNSEIYYDHLHVYASYQNHRITYANATSCPTYQRHKEVNVWSSFIGGNCVNVSPYNGLSLDKEPLMVHIDGRLRWKRKVHLFTKTHHLKVICPAKIHSGDSATGVNVGNNGVKYMLNATCSVVVS